MGSDRQVRNRSKHAESDRRPAETRRPDGCQTEQRVQGISSGPGQTQGGGGGAVQQRQLDPVVHGEETVLPVHGDGGDDHHRQHQRRANGSQEAERDERAAANLAERRGQRERAAGAEAETLQERSGPGESISTEPSKELLRPVGRHQRTEHEASNQQSSIHGTSSIRSGPYYINNSDYMSRSNLPFGHSRGILGIDARAYRANADTGVVRSFSPRQRAHRPAVARGHYLRPAEIALAVRDAPRCDPRYHRPDALRTS